jgi:hypothetical protein
MKKILLSTTAIFFSFFSLLNLAGAQSMSGTVGITISPSNPAPGEQIVVSLESYSVDLNRAKIAWFVDGQIQRTEIGLKKFYGTAGQAGVLTTVSAQVETQNGEIFEKEISFIPAGVDLLYEVVSYTPPFYKGKALNSNESTVVVSAFPEMFDLNGQKLKTQDLIYTWRKDGAVLGDRSGKGRNYLTYTGSVPVRDVEISVSASSLDQTLNASKTITIPRGNPQIVFYENSPAFGLLFNRAINKSVRLTNDEFSVVGMPYYFSAGFPASPNLDYAWTVDSQTITNQEPKNSLTFKQEGPGSGVAQVGLKISNVGRIFQFTNNSFRINYEK